MDYEWIALQCAADISRMGYPKIVLRSDQEPAITAMVDMIKEIRSRARRQTLSGLPDLTPMQMDLQSVVSKQLKV